MDFEWDEDKRLANIAKHGLDFYDAEELFSKPYIVGPGKTVDGEERSLATGVIEDVYATVVFTRRGPIIRIISMRSARDGERKQYQKIFSE